MTPFGEGRMCLRSQAYKSSQTECRLPSLISVCDISCNRSDGRVYQRKISIFRFDDNVKIAHGPLMRERDRCLLPTQLIGVLLYLDAVFPISQVWWGVLEGKNCLGIGGAVDGLVRNRNLLGNFLRTRRRREDLKAGASLEQDCRRVSDILCSTVLAVCTVSCEW